jgi:hypothetical protein
MEPWKAILIGAAGTWVVAVIGSNLGSSLD